MGGRVVSSLKSGKSRGSFTAVLASALLEWILIFMLLVYAIFGFLITRFARCFELPIPCLLCSRIDNILGGEKGGFYWDMICGNHKVEMSSLVFCHFHEKLVDVRGMCETCLFSFATKDKSNAETYRLLVGKLGGEDLSGFDEDPSVEGHTTKSLKHCCCCNELWTPRLQAQTKSIVTDVADVDIPSNREVSQDHDSLEKEAKKSQASSRIIHVREMTEDPSVQFGYTEVKINSDTESDIHDSFEEVKETQTSSTNVHVREKTEDPLIQFGYTELKMTSDTESDVPTSEIHDSSEEANKTQASTAIHVREKMEDPLVDTGYTNLNITSDTESDIEASDVEDARALISDDPLRDLILESRQVEPFISLSEVNSAYNKPIVLDVLSSDPSQTSRDIALSDIIQPHVSPSVPSAHSVGHGLEELNWHDIDHKHNVSASTEPMNVIDHIPVPVVSTDMTSTKLLFTQTDGNVSLDCSKDELASDEAGSAQKLVYETDKVQELESLQTTAHLNSSERSEHTDGDMKMTNYLDLTDAYKLAVSSRGRQSSGKPSEQLAVKNSSSNSSGLKLLLSQFSGGLNLPSTGILSPRVSKNLDDLKTSDSSVSYTMKLLQKRASLERNDSRNSLDRNESGVESLDFSTVPEIEGESELDRLKRQLEHDRRFMMALLKELEEERNASASATNEAMAMITRLQEEKAAFQMEASQDLRMMEEQAEYDMDALDKLNDLVTEKEKEIQNLEAELEYFRCKYPNEFLDSVGDSLSDGGRDEKQISPPKSVPGEKDSQIPEDPWSEIQDESEYLSECLRNLEKKLIMFCDNEKSEGTNGDDLGKQGENISDLISNEAGPEVKSEWDEKGVLSQENSLVTKESRRSLVRRAQSFKHSKCNEAEIASIVNDVSRVNERLQVLEADRVFIERAINALNHGHEELIQEIASRLHELHKVGIRRYQTCSEDRDITVER